MSLEQLSKDIKYAQKKVSIFQDKEKVAKHVIQFVKSEVSKNQEEFDKNEKVYLTKLWEPGKTNDPSLLFPRDFWNTCETNVKPTTFITGSYNHESKRYEFHWMRGSAFTVAQYELEKDGVRLLNETKNRVVTWSVQKCEPMEREEVGRGRFQVQRNRRHRDNWRSQPRQNREMNNEKNTETTNTE